MESTTGHLLLLTSCYARHTRKSQSTISRLSTGSGATMTRLENGKTITIRRAAAAFDWFSAHWPTDLAWPLGIPRPEEHPDPRNESA